MRMSEIFALDPDENLGRGGFFASLMIFAAVPWTVMMFSSKLGTMFLVVFSIWLIFAAMRRLNDMGRSRWWAFTLLIIYLNVVTIGFLLFAPGEDQGVEKADE